MNKKSGSNQAKYDANGKVNTLQRQMPNGSSVDFIRNIQYHPLGGVSSRTLGNGLVESRSYC